MMYASAIIRYLRRALVYQLVDLLFTWLYPFVQLVLLSLRRGSYKTLPAISSEVSVEKEGSAEIGSGEINEPIRCLLAFGYRACS